MARSKSQSATVSAPQPAPRKLKVAIIGTGSISGMHASSVKALTDLEMVGSCDIVLEKAEKAAADRGGRAYCDAGKMLDVEKPDLVLLCTPQMARLDPIRLCAERKIPIFIEKPPADTIERAREISAILKTHPVIHSVGFMFRYLELVQRARQLLKGRKLLMLRQFYYCPISLPGNYEKWPRFFFKKELSGGLVVDQAIHFLDLVRYLTGSEVAEVQGFANNLQHPKHAEFTSDETVSLNLRLKNGVVVSHTHTWAYSRWRGEIDLIAVGAHLQLDLFGKKLRGEIDGMQIEFGPEDNGYLTEVREFVRAIHEQSMTPIRSTYSDAVKSFAVTLALNQSLETGDRVAPAL